MRINAIPKDDADRLIWHPLQSHQTVVQSARATTAGGCPPRYFPSVAGVYDAENQSRGVLALMCVASVKIEMARALRRRALRRNQDPFHT